MLRPGQSARVVEGKGNPVYTVPAPQEQFPHVVNSGLGHLPKLLLYLGLSVHTVGRPQGTHAWASTLLPCVTLHAGKRC